MSFLNIAGGIARGYNQSIDDEYKRQEQEFLKGQRSRLTKEQSEEDELKAGLKTIKPAGEYEAEVSAPDMSGIGITGGYDADAGDAKATLQKAKRKRTDSDVAKDTADMYQSKGRPQEAMQYRQAGIQFGEYERALAIREKEDAVRRRFEPYMMMVTQGGAKGAKQFLQEHGMPYFNGKAPQGKNVAYSENPDGSIDVIFVDKNNPQSVPEEVTHVSAEQLQGAAMSTLDKMIGAELGLIDTNNFNAWRSNLQKDRQLNISQQQADATTMQAQSHAKQVEYMRDYYKPGGVYERVEKMKRDSQERIAQLQRSMESALRGPATEKAKMELINEKDYQQTLSALVNMLDDPKANKDWIAKLSSRLTMLHADKVIKPYTLKHDDGSTSLVSFNTVDSAVKGAFKAAGVVLLPPEGQAALKTAATEAKGDKKKFLASKPAKQAIAAGMTEEDLLTDFLGVKPEPTAATKPAPTAAGAGPEAVPPFVKPFMAR